MPRHSPCFPRAGLLISHTFPSAVMWCSSHCLLLCGLCLFHLQFLSTCLGSRVGFPSQALPLLHTRAWLPITPHPAQPRSPKLPIRLLSSLCTSTGNSEKKHSLSLDPVFPSIPTHRNNMSITLAVPWGLGFNHLTMASVSCLLHGSLRVPLTLFLNQMKICFLHLPICLRTRPAFPLQTVSSWEALLLQAPSYVKKADAS